MVTGGRTLGWLFSSSGCQQKPEDYPVFKFSESHGNTGKPSGHTPSLTILANLFFCQVFLKFFIKNCKIRLKLRIILS